MNLLDYYEAGTPAYILTHDFLGTPIAKTAHGILDYGEIFAVTGIIDRSQAGKKVKDVIPRLKKSADVPIFSDLNEAIKHKKAKVLILGVAAPGGQIPESWRRDICLALQSGLDLIAGMHTFFSEDEEFSRIAEKSGSRIFDLRKPPLNLTVAHQLVRQTNIKVALCLGTDCVVGKRTAAAALYQKSKEQGQNSAFLATGQTGLLLGCDAGVVIDRIPADFVAGQLEKMVLDLHNKGFEFVFAEGQGALLHPAYAGVTLSLLHGTDPQAVILVHDPERKVRDAFDNPPLLMPSWQQERELIEKLSRAKVVALVTWGEKKKKLLQDADLPVFDLTIDQEKELLLAELNKFWENL